jgi:hypothetical protein
MRLKSSRKRAVLALAALLGGSTLFTSCQVVWADAIQRGTEQFVLSLLDPSIILEQLMMEPDGNE